MASITKNASGTYRIRVSCGYTAKGKQISRQTTWKPPSNMSATRADKEAQKFAVLFEQQCLEGNYVDHSIKFSDFTDRWLSDYAQVQLRPDTLRGYQSLLPKITAAIGHIKLAKLQPHHIIEFLKSLSEDGSRRDSTYKPNFDLQAILTKKGLTKQHAAIVAGVSATTLLQICRGNSIKYKSADAVCKAFGLRFNQAFTKNKIQKLSGNSQLHYFHVIQSILSTAVKWQIIPTNPCSRIDPPKKGLQRQAILSLDETRRLVTCLKSEDILYRTAVLLLLYSGARRSEIYGLKWEDIEFERMQISINKAWTKGTDKKFNYFPCKTSSSQRVVALPRCCEMLLKEWRAYQNSQRLKCGDYWKSLNDNPLLTTADGAHANPDTLTGWFRKFCRKNNFPETIHIHSLRHTATTFEIEAHQSIRDVSARLGHSQTSTTMNLYSHALQSADAKAADILGKLIPLEDDSEDKTFHKK